MEARRLCPPSGFVAPNFFFDRRSAQVPVIVLPGTYASALADFPRSVTKFGKDKFTIKRGGKLT